MNLVLISAFFVIVILSTVHGKSVDNGAEILKYENEVRPDGYNFRYTTSNGVRRYEQGQLKQNQEALDVKGAFRFKLPDGNFQSVTFQADENGYRPIVKISPAVFGASTPGPQYIPPCVINSLTGGGCGG